MHILNSLMLENIQAMYLEKYKSCVKQFFKKTDVEWSFSMMIYALPNRVPPCISNLLSCIILNVLDVMPVMWEKQQDIWIQVYTDS